MNTHDTLNIFHLHFYSTAVIFEQCFFFTLLLSFSPLINACIHLILLTYSQCKRIYFHKNPWIACVFVDFTIYLESMLIKQKNRSFYHSHSVCITQCEYVYIFHFIGVEKLWLDMSFSLFQPLFLVGLLSHFIMHRKLPLFSSFVR